MKYSFLIPVYNRPDEVDELLQSLTEQTRRDFEVIVVDDGSSLPCRDVADRYAGLLDLRYFTKPNSGPGQTRNYAAERAQGDYLLILDSDCIVPPGYLEAIDRELQREPCDAFGGPDRAHPSFTPMQKAINYSMTSFFTTGGIRGGKKKMDKFYPRSFNMGVRREVYRALGGFSRLHPRVRYELYSADGDDIREKLDRGGLDFGVLLEPVEAAKYDSIRLPYWETWGVVLPKDDPLAQKKAIGKEDILSIPLILPRREIVQDNIAGWFGVERGQLNIFAGHNLVTNATLLAKAGLGYPVCVGGSFEIRGGENLCFRPFTPERTTGHVLAWKKNRVFHSAAACFRAYIQETKSV